MDGFSEDFTKSSDSDSGTLPQPRIGVTSVLRGASDTPTTLTTPFTSVIRVNARNNFKANRPAPLQTRGDQRPTVHPLRNSLFANRRRQVGSDSSVLLSPNSLLSPSEGTPMDMSEIGTIGSLASPLTRGGGHRPFASVVAVDGKVERRNRSVEPQRRGTVGDDSADTGTSEIGSRRFAANGTTGSHKPRSLSTDNVETRMLSVLKRSVKFSELPDEIIPDLDSLSSVKHKGGHKPSRDVVKQQRSIVRRMLRSIATLKQRLGVAVFKARTLDRFAVLPYRLQRELRSALQACAFTPNKKDPFIRSIETLHQSSFVVATLRLLDDQTAACDGALVACQSHCRFESTLTAALASLVRDGYDALQRAHVEAVDVYSDAHVKDVSRDEFEKRLSSEQASVSLLREDSGWLPINQVRDNPTAVFDRNHPDPIARHAWKRVASEWTRLCAHTPSLPPQHDISALRSLVKERESELQALEQQKVELSRSMDDLRLTIGTKLQRESAKQDALTTSLSQLEAKSDALHHSYTIVTDACDLSRGLDKLDPTTRDAVVAERLSGVEKLLAQRKMITSALSAVKRDGESKLVLLQAQLNRTYSSDIAVCQSSQHEKSSWLEAQSTSLKQRIAQVQCEIDELQATVLEDSGIPKHTAELHWLREAVASEWTKAQLPILTRVRFLSQVLSVSPYTIPMHTLFRRELSSLITTAANVNATLHADRLAKCVARLEHAVVVNAPDPKYSRWSGLLSRTRALQPQPSQKPTKPSFRDVVSAVLQQSKKGSSQVLTSTVPAPIKQSGSRLGKQPPVVCTASDFVRAGVLSSTDNIPPNYVMSPSEAVASAVTLKQMRSDLTELRKRLGVRA